MYNWFESDFSNQMMVSKRDESLLNKTRAPFALDYRPIKRIDQYLYIGIIHLRTNFIHINDKKII